MKADLTEVTTAIQSEKSCVYSKIKCDHRFLAISHSIVIFAGQRDTEEQFVIARQEGLGV
ncbi:hypothetical protein [Tolumonas lignilytica]|jgi:hypothetical protein|uniref:hypothetical protein n=1 Tax=Tolumonas lignilytica TaxID=1283284 RepID=UPI000466C590|nr:hypothetical protein [Tolumonas lignilytica]